MPAGRRSKLPPELIVPPLLQFQCHTRAASRLLGASQGPRWLEDVLALPVLASLPSGRRKGSCCHHCWFPRTDLSRCLYFTKVPLPTPTAHPARYRRVMWTANSVVTRLECLPFVHVHGNMLACVRASQRTCGTFYYIGAGLPFWYNSPLLPSPFVYRLFYTDSSACGLTRGHCSLSSPL